MENRYLRILSILILSSTVFFFSFASISQAIDTGQIDEDPLEPEKPTPYPDLEAYRQYYRFGGGGTKVANPDDFITDKYGYVRQRSGNMVEATAPDINIWYGTEQSFGQLGTPQQWINILGNITASAPVSLSYSVNAGIETELAVGPDVRRLVGAGDFDIELDKDSLLTGSANQIIITATDTINNLTSIEIISVTYDATTTWPLSYTVDWGTVNNITDVVQIVDGFWTFSDSGVRIDPGAVGYDRIVAIGDMDWTDIEVTIPITVHALDTSAYGSPYSVSPGIGLVPRWQGHTNNPSYSQDGCSMGMHCGWLPAGANPWYDFAFDPADAEWRLESGGSSAPDPLNRKMALDTMYYWKLRLQTVTDGTEYSFKVWQDGEAEPGWQMTRFENPAWYSDYSAQGSLLLVAHHVDATFGDLIIEPVSGVETFSLDVSTSGSGSVTVDPDQATYITGTIVTLTPNANAGWIFTGWSGDLTGSANPVSLTMDAHKAVTATFSEIGSGYSLTLDKTGSGTVTVDPDQTFFSDGTVVTVTASAATGWDFTGWSGDLTGSTNPLTLTMSADKVVTATFVTNADSGLKSDDFDDNSLESFWTFYQGRAGDPAPAFSDSQVMITVPAGQEHSIGATGTFASRIMQTTPDVDFVVEVKFDSTVSASYQTQGIVVTQANGDALRLEFYFAGSSTYLYAASYIGGAETMHHNIVIGGSRAPLYMKVTRKGNDWTHAYSDDGVLWNSYDFTQAFSVSQVGVYAGNEGLSSGNEPEHTAIIDYFHVSPGGTVILPDLDKKVYLPLIVKAQD